MFRLFLWSFFFSLSCLSAAIERSDDHELFLREFIATYNQANVESPISIVDIVGVDEICGRGVLNCGVYRVALLNKPAIFCKGSFASNVEPKNCEACMTFLKENYADDKEGGRPQFARYLGSFLFKGFVVEREKTDLTCTLYGQMNRGIMLMEEAQGVCASELFLEEPVREELIKRIGESVAQFHLAFMEQQGEDFVSLLHGDLHIDNMFVLLEPFVVTFIDYDSLVYTLYCGKQSITDELALFSTRTSAILRRQGKSEAESTRLIDLFKAGYFDALARATDMAKNN